MKWFRWFERRDLGGDALLSLFSAAPTAAGVTVTAERALTAPVVKACVKVLSEDIGKTPLRLRRRLGPDTFVDDEGHDLWEILHDLPNAETDAFTLKRKITADMLVYGVGYAQILRSGDGRVDALWYLPASAVSVDRDEQRRKRWRVTVGGRVETFTFDASMPPILEIPFDSPIAHCREAIGTMLALQDYTGRFFSNGARPSGALVAGGAISPTQAQALRTQWQAIHQGTANSHKIAVFENGLKFEPFASPNDHAQLNELLQTLRNEICGAFRVPPFKVSDLTRANYSNVEALAIEYVTGTLDPLFTAWELALRRDVLTNRQYQAFRIDFNRAALIQSDTRTLHAALATARQNGILSVNDCRRLLGMNPISAADGGDKYLVNSALTPLADAGQGLPAPGGN